MRLETTSFPVPVGPFIKTVAFVEEIFRIKFTSFAVLSAAQGRLGVFLEQFLKKYVHSIALKDYFFPTLMAPLR